MGLASGLMTADIPVGNERLAASLALLPLHAPHVELQLLALDDEAISATALAGPRGDAGIQPPSGKLVIDCLFNRPVSIALLDLALQVVGPLDLLQAAFVR